MFEASGVWSKQKWSYVGSSQDGGEFDSHILQNNEIPNQALASVFQDRLELVKYAKPTADDKT